MLILILNYFLLATVYLLSQHTVTIVHPLWINTFTALFAACILIGTSIIPRYRMTWSAQRFKTVLIVSLCVGIGATALRFVALQYLPAATISLLFTGDPFITALLSFILLNQRLRWGQLSGMILACISILPLLANTASFNDTYLLWPLGIVITSIVANRLGWLYFQHYGPPTELIIPFSAVVSLISGIGSLLLALWFAPLSVETIFLFPWKSIVYITLVNNIVCSLIYFYCAKKYPLTLLSLGEFLIPVFTALLSLIIYHIPITPLFIFSLTGTACGLLLFYVSK